MWIYFIHWNRDFETCFFLLLLFALSAAGKIIWDTEDNQESLVPVEMGSHYNVLMANMEFCWLFWNEVLSFHFHIVPQL